MHGKLVCRLCGWLFAALAVLGLTVGHVGDYMQLTRADSVLHLGIAVLFIYAARSRYRTTTAVGLLLGFAVCGWGMAGLWAPHLAWLANDPLEGALRVVAGGWAMYGALADMMVWRRMGLAS